MRRLAQRGAVRALQAGVWISAWIGGSACLSPIAQAQALVRDLQGSFQMGAAEAFVATPYLRQDGATLVLHLQPQRAAVADRIVAVPSGEVLSIRAQDLASQYEPLGFEQADTLAGSTHRDHQQLRLLGCAAPYSHCSSPLDSDLVLMMGRPDATGRVPMRLVDQRPLFDGLLAVLRGERDLPQHPSAWEWQLVQLAAATRQRRQQWWAATEAVDDAERWQRLSTALTQGPALLRQSAFQHGGPGIDLQLATELALATALSRDGHAHWRAQGDASALANALTHLASSSYPPMVLERALATLVTQTPQDLDTLSQALRQAALQRRSTDLWCVAAWLRSQACDTPGWLQTPKQEGVPGTGARPSRTRPNAMPERSPGDAAAEPAPEPGAGTSPTVRAGEAALREFLDIQRLPSPLVLARFDERSGQMQPVADASLANYSFVATSVGKPSDGRFSIEIQPNPRAPFLVRAGDYQVSVDIQLDYTREDRCVQGFLCLFEGAQRHTKTQRKQLEFRLNPGNAYRQRVEQQFRVQPDASGRYSFALVQARLSITKARYQPFQHVAGPP